ncbi:hypothetical protein IAR55_005638 [Kwoniella newhampshirensis]|uniref:Uncharacterized protein n=1 Tax=Kwoniella newhampshirensis TaxID=1651941 RepID=A0AAW0YKJ4_9TREE
MQIDHRQTLLLLISSSDRRSKMTGSASEHDDILLAVPWQVKSDQNGKSHLFKYARHPDRTGYIFLTTDLTSINNEILYGHSLQSRLLASTQLLDVDDQAQWDGYDDPFDKVDEGMKRLKSMMGGDWDEVQLEVKTDEDYDLVMVLRTNTFAWIFNLTEMKGRRPLALLSRHLLAPLTSLIAQDRSLRLTNPDFQERSMEVIAHKEIIRDLNRVRNDQSSDPGSRIVGDYEERTDDTPRRKGERVSRNTPTRSSKVFSPKGRTTKSGSLTSENSPPPTNRNVRSTHPRRISSPPSSEVSARPSSSTSTPPKGTKQPNSASRHRSRPSSTSPDAVPTPKPKLKTKRSTSPPPSNPAPIPSGDFKPPTQTQKSLSQKTKREREMEEEEEMEKRLLEMRKKMASGGGGKLGKRRLAR